MTKDTIGYCESDSCDKQEQVPVYLWKKRYWCVDCLRAEFATLISGIYKRLTKDMKELAMQNMSKEIKEVFSTVNPRKQNEIMKIVLQNMILPSKKQLNLSLKPHELYGRVRIAWFANDQYVSREDLETYLYLTLINRKLPYKVMWLSRCASE